MQTVRNVMYVLNSSQGCTHKFQTYGAMILAGWDYHIPGCHGVSLLNHHGIFYACKLIVELDFQINKDYYCHHSHSNDSLPVHFL